MTRPCSRAVDCAATGTGLRKGRTFFAMVMDSTSVSGSVVDVSKAAPTLDTQPRQGHGCDEGQLCRWKQSFFACGKKRSWALRSRAGGYAGSAVGDGVGSAFT